MPPFLPSFAHPWSKFCMKAVVVSSSMSDNSDSGSDDNRSSRYQENGKDDDICRDYLRNVCKRGKRCRYRHPEATETKALGKKPEFTFCHDFQNTGCRRSTCRFLHCTREEEDIYNQIGQLPSRIQQAAALGIGVTTRDIHILKGEVPICKDFMKRECKRGSKCKYRHLSADQYELERRKTEVVNNTTQSPSFTPPTYNNDPYDRLEQLERLESAQMASKRRRIDFFHSVPMSFQFLEEENMLLRRKVEELKKSVSDLTATNEVLLEQNARYRVSKSNAIVAAAAAAAAAPTLSHLNHVNSTLSQQIALNSEMATQHALQTAQHLAAREMAPQPQPLNTSVAMNPHTSVAMNPPTIVAVTLAQTMAAASLTTASLQQNLQPVCSMTQSIPPNMAASTTALISYPIMSQSMRSAIPSSLAAPMNNM
ncbi:zinc finger CCCH domain-containing protein 10-like [Gigantopelta aegis]|uniref:zinc finger CCCH domain-containing protein 10-like n=1 Tax=Gigantopelta aegis TaxID=1735272 RepID=UPI001B88B1FB|nr:zinc finger CCCH domain-containing protein 10-like [Gigantopelta aegis]XP_041366083.1 zinc finger CCCH domain-containing protein 10-like [Gigantopelta aegis]XP_041366084.1 zinc finger CCCH domain-containing protein 10-like [Gigantopelta aegis]XP_041366086.1 zinc finger CCCH domain-containing protein 10-like [Gigantopelta aegis]